MGEVPRVLPLVGFSVRASVQHIIGRKRSHLTAQGQLHHVGRCLSFAFQEDDGTQLRGVNMSSSTTALLLCNLSFVACGTPYQANLSRTSAQTFLFEESADRITCSR